MFPVAFSTVETGKVEGNKGGGDKKNRKRPGRRESQETIIYSVTLLLFFIFILTRDLIASDFIDKVSGLFSYYNITTSSGTWPMRRDGRFYWRGRAFTL